MELVRKVEKSLGDMLKDTPKLPKNVTETLANIAPWLVLIFGVLQLAGAWALWRLMDRVQPLADLANQYSQYFGGETIGYSAGQKAVIYFSIALLVIEAVLMLMAFSPLKERLKRGWDLVFMSSLISVAYSVLLIFIDNRGFGSFLFSLIGTAVGFYILFQVRPLYSSKAATHKPTKPTA